MRGVPTQKDGNIARPVREGIDIRPDRSGDGAEIREEGIDIMCVICLKQ